MDITILTHTHSDCEDLWEPYFNSYQEYFNECEHLVLINRETNKINKKQIIYNENDKYSDRLLNVLKTIKTEYVIISFEDMILYNTVLITELKKIIDVMDLDKSIMFTRLIKSGIISNHNFNDKLYLLEPNDFQFSITPTIWRIETLLSVLENLKNLTIWELETSGHNFIKNNNLTGLYYYGGEKIRGLNHYDSDIYPHICSAIFKGKWNISEYKDELNIIIKKYNININERGFI